MPPPDVEQIVREARELNAGERAAFLESACRGDDDLRRRIERRLETGGGTEADLPTSVTPADAATMQLPTAALLDEQPGVRIGHYRLIEQIGEGGFGVVFSAEQSEPVRRRVALKIIKLGMDTREVIARFDAERQALAIMDHPGIAKVFDAGATDSGRPYFVMEFVAGVPITEFCDTHNLDVPERLRLFQRVCHAVQHAHQKGVIHRDIKPSNVLVTLNDGEPVPKVIDFGIAKATSARLTEKTFFTQQRQLIGTPAYMSPEQAQSEGIDIDTRADVYSLGVLLYELLTGVTPFDAAKLHSAAYGELQRIIREETPLLPSTRLGSLATLPDVAAHRRTEPRKLGTIIRGDLDWIVMKAMEKSRMRRYETASGFAEDIQRYLDDEPVAASPPSKLYAFGKFARRNRGALVATLIVITAIILGAAGAVSGLIAARADAERAGRAERQAQSDRDSAEAVTGFLADMLKSVDPGREGLDVSVRQVLDAASATIGDRFPEQPLVEARLRLTMGQTYYALGLYDEAERHVREAVAIRERELDPDDLETADAVQELARINWRQGKFEAAEALNARALDVRTRVLGEDDVQTLRTMTNVAVTQIEKEYFEEAGALLERVIEIGTRVLGTDHEQTLTACDNLGRVRLHERQFDEAEALFRRVIDGRTRELGAEHPRTLMSMNRLGFMLYDTEQHDRAEPILRETYETRRRVLGEAHPDTLMSAYNLGHLLVDTGRDDEGERLYRLTLDGRAAALGDDHPEVGAVAMQFGIFLAQRERFDEAEPLFVRTAEIYRESLDPDHPSRARAIRNLGFFYEMTDRPELAEPVYVEAMEMRVKRYGERHPETIDSMNDVAVLRGQIPEKLAEAEVLSGRAVELARDVHGPEHRRFVMYTNTRIEILHRLGRHDEAADLVLGILPAARRVYGDALEEKVSAAEFVATLRLAGRDAEATALEQEFAGGDATDATEPE